MPSRSVIFHSVLGSVYTLIAALTVAGCRVKVDKPEGETPSGVKLDPSLPKDARLLQFFESIPVIDYTKGPNYTKCTYNNYELNTETGEFSTEPEPNASVSTYSYDSEGRKIKEIYEYGTSSYRSKSVTEWIYDTKGRVAKTLSGSLKSDGTTAVSSNCRYTYVGDTARLTKWECFSGEGSEDADKNESIEVAFNETELTRTVTKKRKIYSTDEFVLESVLKEVHANKDFSFPIKSTDEFYKYDSGSKTSKLEGEKITEIVFESDKFAGLLKIDSDITDGEKKKSSELKCVFEKQILNCTGNVYGDKEEVIVSGELELNPAHVKYRPSDLLVCTSPVSCNNSGQVSLSEVKFSELQASFTLLGVEGKTDSKGEAPAKRRERIVKFGSSLQPWMIDNPPEYSDYTIDADGNHYEERSTTTDSKDGTTIMSIEQKRAKSGEAKTRDELGEFKNYKKSATICEMK